MRAISLFFWEDCEHDRETSLIPEKEYAMNVTVQRTAPLSAMILNVMLLGAVSLRAGHHGTQLPEHAREAKGARWRFFR